MFGSGAGLPSSSSSLSSASGIGNKETEQPSLANALLQSGAGGSSTRLQLFRRRGAQGKQNGNERMAAKGPVASASASASASAVSVSSFSSSVGMGSNGLARNESAIQSKASVATTDSDSDVLGNALGPLHEKYLGFIALCSQQLAASAAVSARAGKTMKETAQLVQRISCLLAPPAGPKATEYAASMARGTVEQFGYAVVESRHSVTEEVVGILLQFLNVSQRTRLALKYLRDEQLARMLGRDERMDSMVSGAATMVFASGRGELRRVDLCLQLLMSVLGAAASGESGVGRTRMCGEMMSKLRHLLDLVIVAKPVSDKASRVLQVLLQRFDEGCPANGSCSGLAEEGDRRYLWYQSDAVVLLSAARNALARLVGFGIDQEQAQPSDSEAYAEESSGDESCESTRSVLVSAPASSTPSSASLSLSSDFGGDDILAQLDEFDKELDAVLNE
ncbi:hypothetical protein LPJ57_008358 [Coemansia sp. RSA 486]|nr:hypothetical protein LPJ57_008358 [Coemansia sp. RSA 486]